MGRMRKKRRSSNFTYNRNQPATTNNRNRQQTGGLIQRGLHPKKSSRARGQQPHQIETVFIRWRRSSSDRDGPRLLVVYLLDLDSVLHQLVDVHGGLRGVEGVRALILRA